MNAFYFLSRRSGALPLAALASLVLTLAAFPFPALAQGFVQGLYPRAVSLDQNSSAALNGGPVRLLTFEKRVWRLPAPEDFLDIETLTNDTLPNWAKAPAINLRPWSVAYYADPAAKDGPPPYSLAFLELVTKENRHEADALNSPPKGSRRRDNTCTALSNYLDHKTAMDGSLWKNALDEALKGEGLSCRYNKGDARVVLDMTAGVGDVLPGVKERLEECSRLTGQPVDPGSREALQAHMKIADECLKEFPPGGLPSSTHPAGRATLLFPVGKQRVLLTVEFGPLSTPEELKNALDRATRWKEQVLMLNKK